MPACVVLSQQLLHPSVYPAMHGVLIEGVLLFYRTCTLCKAKEQVLIVTFPSLLSGYRLQRGGGGHNNINRTICSLYHASMYSMNANTHPKLDLGGSCDSSYRYLCIVLKT